MEWSPEGSKIGVLGMFGSFGSSKKDIIWKAHSTASLEETT